MSLPPIYEEGKLRFELSLQQEGLEVEQHRLVFAAQSTAPNSLLVTAITHQPSRG